MPREDEFASQADLTSSPSIRSGRVHWLRAGRMVSSNSGTLIGLSDLGPFSLLSSAHPLACLWRGLGLGVGPAAESFGYEPVHRPLHGG
jgi:hypothetical protein